MKNAIDIVFALIGVFFAYGGGKWLSKELAVKASTERNENIKTVLTFASQYVLEAQKFLGSGAIQQQHALSQLKQRVSDNELVQKFTDEQLVQYIEQQYTALKANGQLQQVSKVVSDEALAEAEQVIDGASETTQKPTNTI